MSQRFHFRFQAVLRVREAERDAIRMELAAAMATADTIRERRSDLAALKREAMWRHRASRLGVIRAETLREQARYEQTLALQDARLVAEEAEAELRVEAIRTGLQAAEIECRRWDKLSSRDHRAHRERFLAAEQREAEEINRGKVKMDRSQRSGE
ncbi:MAG: hypothetical protein EA381_03865 [Planctomycetaceae bacterium]|nr:MAG: hypothetical protein EA381_03865 [Planctomycetaceae bacterium]